MGNYITRKINFEILESEGNTELIKIDGKIYTVDYNGNDPEYINDGVLDLSYYNLIDEDGEELADHILAFDATGNPDAEEWGDQYDVENMYVLKLN